MEGPSGSLAPSGGNAGKCLVLSVRSTNALGAAPVLGMLRENWRSALLQSLVQEQLEIPHPSDQLSEAQGWSDAKPGLCRRCSATGQLAGSLKMNTDCSLCLDPLSPWDKVPKPVAACTVWLQLHLQLLTSVMLLWPPFPSPNLLAPSYLRAFAVPATWSSLPTSSHGYFLSVLQFSSPVSWVPKTQGPIVHVGTCHAVTNVCRGCYQMIIYMTSRSL